MPPAIAAAGVGAASGIAGSLIEASATRDATSAQIQANRESIAAQKEYADKALKFNAEQAAIARQDLAPLREAQTQAIGQLQGLSDPNNELYKQQRNVNTQQILAQLSAQGLLRSKNQTDLLTNLELGLNQQRAGIIQGLAGLGGLQASSQIAQNLGGLGAQTLTGLGQGIGSSFQNAGNIIGQGILGNSNAIRSGIASTNNAFQGYLSNVQSERNQENSLAQLKLLLGK